MERLTKRIISGIEVLGAVITRSSRGWVYKMADRLAAYEDTGMEPEEIIAALDSATKLIATMRNNKKAALWLRNYGEDRHAK